MKSPMVKGATYIDKTDKGNYSDLQVLQSAAGYYIGTLYTDSKGFVDMGSRDSEYFGTEKEAQTELELLEKGNSDIILRINP